MIVHGCIEIHPKDCGMNYCNGVQDFINFATSILTASRCCNDASSTQRVYGELPVLVCTQRSICS
jgi:hypothetical protein